ncbi:MAG: hypothetical protein GX542_10545 [Rhodococcus sp.]|nr:hypothetical protein [Rhodococcus sp. (in: high G+C Gram-positive bacteria)]
MNVRSLIGGVLSVGAAGISAVALAAPASAAPQPAVLAMSSCPTGYVCGPPVECPWEWRLHYLSGFVWQQQAYCITPGAAPSERTLWQRERVEDQKRGIVY